MQDRGAIRTGDRVVWNNPQFSRGTFFRGKCKGAKYLGSVTLSGIVIKHSYGMKTGQHTFSIQLDNGTRKLVKGRNLYPNLVEHIPDMNSIDRKEN